MATYEIYYTQTAEQDILEKFSYIMHQFKDPALAEAWYMRLREAIQNNLSEFPEKYSLYNVPPWNEKGIRQFVCHNDVILYSVDAICKRVYIRSVCTQGRDLSAHLTEQDDTQSDHN